MRLFLALSVLLFFQTLFSAETAGKVFDRIENSISAYDLCDIRSNLQEKISAVRQSIDDIQAFDWSQQDIKFVPYWSVVHIERLRCRISWILEEYKSQFEYNPTGRAEELRYLDAALKGCQNFKREILTRRSSEIPRPNGESLYLPPPIIIENPGRIPTVMELNRIEDMVRSLRDALKESNVRRAYKIVTGSSDKELKGLLGRTLEAETGYLCLFDGLEAERKNPLYELLLTSPENWHFSKVRPDNSHLSGDHQVNCFNFLQRTPGGKYQTLALARLGTEGEFGEFFPVIPSHQLLDRPCLVVVSDEESNQIVLRAGQLKTALNDSEGATLLCLSPGHISDVASQDEVALAQAVYADRDSLKVILDRAIQNPKNFRKLVNRDCNALSYLANASIDDVDVPLLKDSLCITGSPAAGSISWIGGHGSRGPFMASVLDHFTLSPQK